MTFIPNKNLGKELEAQPQYNSGLAKAAEPAKAAAEKFAPRIMRRNPQAMQIVVEGRKVYLGNTDYGAHLAEYGSVNNPPYAPLRRGVRAAGLKFIESSK